MCLVVTRVTGVTLFRKGTPMHESSPDALHALRTKAVALAIRYTSEEYKILLEFMRIAVAILSQEEISHRAD